MMSKLTYIMQGRIETITHPRGEALLAVLWSLRRGGFQARLWAADGSLIS